MDKAGYRGKHHLWSRRFVRVAGCPDRYADGLYERFAPMTAPGIAALAEWCLERPASNWSPWRRPADTGSFGLRRAVGCRGLPVAVLNPRAVRRFAEGMGLLEKTDRIDAGVIAWYAETRRQQAHHPGRQDPGTACSLGHTALPADRGSRSFRDHRGTPRHRFEIVLKGFPSEVLAVIVRQIRSLEGEDRRPDRPTIPCGRSSTRRSAPSRVSPIAPSPA